MASSTSLTLTLGTRKSALARKQTAMVVEALSRSSPDTRVDTMAMDSAADKDKITALFKMGDKNLWTGELEEVLLQGAIQGIVHSLKDVSTTLPAHCQLGAILAREDPRDALVLPQSSPHVSPTKSATEILKSLPEGSTIGTSSLRRTAQLRAKYPHLRFAICRGNIDTRLRKLDFPESFTDQQVPRYAALILAAAGLLRMGWEKRISASLSSQPEEGGILWAVGQGAIGIEVTDKHEDGPARDALKTLIDVETWRACLAERSLMRTLEGGCSVPIGVETEWLNGLRGSGWSRSGKQAKEGDDDILELKAVVVALDGSKTVEAVERRLVTSDDDAESLGKLVANTLRERGASEILSDVNVEREKQKAEDAKKIEELKRAAENQE